MLRCYALLSTEAETKNLFKVFIKWIYKLVDFI